MPMQAGTRRGCVLVAVLAWASAMPDSAYPQDADAGPAYAVVAPPVCVNNLGEAVRFVDRGAEGTGIAAGMAARDTDGEPVVFRSNYTAAPPEFQRFIDRHECAHHQTGDVDRPHPPRNGPEHLMNESVSDCVAILRLRDEEGYDEAALGTVSAAMRDDMAKIGFPSISIDSRTGNLTNCYARQGTSRDLVNKILEQRGLPVQ